MNNPFVLDVNLYKRDINPINQYREQAVEYLHLMGGKDKSSCLEFVNKVISNKTSFKIKDPKVTYFTRGDNGDRAPAESTLNQYLTESLQEKELIAPTLTTYINPSVKESLLVSYVEDNVAARSKAKKAAFAADAAKKKDLAAIKNIEQKNKKLSNNAVSGAHASASTPLYNKTAHSTLTSTCRSTSGYGNANNEKFLSGNRHYWSPNIVNNNIISIITHTDYKQLNEIVDKYKLHIPSVEETLTCIKHSTSLYWTNKKEEENIYKLISSLTDIQRQAFVYTGDMYHLMVYNPLLVKEFLKQLSKKITGKIDNSITIVKKANEDTVNLAHQICSTEMKGKGKDHDAMIGTVELDTLALIIKNIDEVLLKYTDLIQALWVTDNVPASVAYFPESIRKVVVTSDTDSTIFTVQEWVSWYNGSISFNEECMALAATVIFLASQTITHVLSKMSVNFGVETKRLKQIAMKNEFKFDVFVPTQVSKHYYALISCQEGNVFEKFKKEIKGVHLISSNAPLKITKRATELMEEIMNSIIKGKKISMVKILKDVANIERTISESIKKGELDYFRQAQIKTPNSYKAHERSSPYGHHLFWNEVFAPKYGDIASPPYSCIKLSTILDNPSSTKNWIDSIEDKELAKRASNWLSAGDKSKVPTILLSIDAIRSNGIPKELISIIDIRTMISDLTRIFYIILETMGFYMLNDKVTRLISDEY